MTQARRGGTLLAGVALVGALASCTSSSKHAAQTVTSLPAVSTPVVSAPASSPVDSSSVPVPSTPAPSTSVSSTTPVRASSPAAPRSTCTTVTVRVIRGSASLGQEIAALQFTNEGTRSCVLVGFPTVTLLRKNQVLGTASQPSTPSSTSRLILGPGEVAESVLHDYTQTCNANLSDNVRVQVPGSTTTAIRPAELRGCILRVDKLGPPQ